MSSKIGSRFPKVAPPIFITIGLSITTFIIPSHQDSFLPQHGNGIGIPIPFIPFLIVIDWSNYNKCLILFSSAPPSNEASYNIVKRGTKNAEERVYTGTDYQQTQGS